MKLYKISIKIDKGFQELFILTRGKIKKKDIDIILYNLHQKEMNIEDSFIYYNDEWLKALRTFRRVKLWPNVISGTIYMEKIIISKISPIILDV